MGNQIGRLIVLEGCDEVGKSTISARLEESIRSADREVVILSFPGQEAGSVGKWVYDLHHASDRKDMNQTCLQLLHVAAHIDCIESQVKPLLSAGTDVVLDRYWWSTVVYGVAGGVAHNQLMKMVELEAESWGRHTPNVVFHIRRRAAEVIANPDVVTGYERISQEQRKFHPVAEIWNEATLTDTLEQIEAKLRAAAETNPIVLSRL